MPSLELASGSLRVSYPDSYDVAPKPPATSRQQGRSSGTSAASGLTGLSGLTGQVGQVGPTDAVSASLLDAFAAQNLELVEPFELLPATPEGRSGRRAPSSGEPERLRIELDLAGERDAVVLLEQDGFFSWQLPTGHGKVPGGSRRSAAPDRAARGGTAPVTRVVRFDLDMTAPGSARPGARTRATPRPVGNIVPGGLKAYVLNFAAPVIPGALLSFLERDTHPGLVVMTGIDVNSWTLVDNLTQVRLPEDRPAKILLFVHGTFSTTAGSYGVLTATAPGKQFLKTAAGSYDAVIGFDHRTLSRDPLENAIDLLSRLEARHLASSPAIDIVSYSRGALVARSLIEYLLPSSPWRANIGTVVFVGATNAGTLLAEPENWKTLVDLYTNLAAGTARSMGFATGRPPATAIVNGMFSGIGAFVKYLGSELVKNWHIPGLAAMEPDGPFITGINATQPGQPQSGTPWYVVSSDFEPSLYDDRHEPPDLPAELVARLADGLVDKVMGAKNDLVVNTSSMSSIDLPSGGGFIKDSLGFGTNGVVHHLNYLSQPGVCRALTDWLIRPAIGGDGGLGERPPTPHH
jgi:hypothetical protein